MTLYSSKTNRDYLQSREDGEVSNRRIICNLFIDLLWRRYGPRDTSRPTLVVILSTSGKEVSYFDHL